MQCRAVASFPAGSLWSCSPQRWNACRGSREASTRSSRPSTSWTASRAPSTTSNTSQSASAASHRRSCTLAPLDGRSFRRPLPLLPSSMPLCEQFGPPRALLLLRCSDDVLRERRAARSATSRRPDDTQEIMEKRIRSYYRDTVPVLRWWMQSDSVINAGGTSPGRGHSELRWMKTIDGERSIEDVYESVRNAYMDWLTRCHDTPPLK